jgi:hypothetical protein
LYKLGVGEPTSYKRLKRTNKVHQEPGMGPSRPPMWGTLCSWRWGSRYSWRGCHGWAANHRGTLSWWGVGPRIWVIAGSLGFLTTLPSGSTTSCTTLGLAPCKGAWSPWMWIPHTLVYSNFMEFQMVTHHLDWVIWRGNNEEWVEGRQTCSWCTLEAHCSPCSRMWRRGLFGSMVQWTHWIRTRWGLEPRTTT